MHPAPSVILFTSLSGLGFGLLAWLGLGYPDVSGAAAFGMYFLGYGFAVGGLLASVTHLGNPKNAIKSFSQWRTSWLSREGVMAVATLLVVAPYAIGEIFLDGAPAWLGVLGSIGAVLTVFTTSMIYTQLKTVPRWHQPLTPVLFLGYSIGGGALLAGQNMVAIVLLALVAVAQIAAWAYGDGQFSRVGSTLETATGLGRIGKVRQLESPHSGTNYLLKEMAYHVGRKHASKLRILGFTLAFVLPVWFLFVLPIGPVWTGIALIVHLAGVFAVRWLFFAEAKHVVSLYYTG